MSARLLLVYHSQSGATEALAEAVARGARREAVELRVRRAYEAGLNDLLWCDGVLFGTPENLGYLSGAMKDFFDRTFYPAEPHQLNRPYALFVSAGNDGTGAVRQLERIVKGYPLKKAAEPLIVVGEPDDTALHDCEDLGQGFAAGLSMGIF